MFTFTLAILVVPSRCCCPDRAVTSLIWSPERYQGGFFPTGFVKVVPIFGSGDVEGDSRTYSEQSEDAALELLRLVPLLSIFMSSGFTVPRLPMKFTLGLSLLFFCRSSFVQEAHWCPPPPSHNPIL